MKIYILALLLSIFCLSSTSQNMIRFDNEKPKSFSVNLKLRNNTGKLSEAPFHVGIEYGQLFKLTEKSDNGDAFWIFLDFNIWNKIIYIRLDLGGFAERSFHSGAAFVSLGLNGRFFGYGRHNFYLFIGFKGALSIFPVALFVVNPKYVFSLSKNIGISGGVRYMERIGYTQRFLIPSIGIQFFINP